MDSKKEMPLIQNLDHFPLLVNHNTIVHQPDKFIIDFKGLYPQFTPDNKPQMVASHKVVVMEPQAAKDFLKSLEDNIKKYEEKFGKIKESEAMKKAKKERTKESKKAKKTSKEKSDSSRPTYMG